MLTKCTREEVAKPQHPGLVLQHQPQTAMETPGFATASHIKGVTITASREANTCTFNLRNNEMARMAGLEPATAALTVRCPTIGRHPNLYRQHPN